VLESKDEHMNVYEDSCKNVESILEYGHSVCFETDATRLEASFPNETFHSIRWNFPHWHGKTNNKYNRKLLNDFFASASKVLTPTNKGTKLLPTTIQIALMNRQGGAMSKSRLEWKHSWIPARLAAYHDLLLTDVQPFVPTYKLSSYRRRDRSFRVEDPYLYTFSKYEPPSTLHAPTNLQLYCQCELYLKPLHTPIHNHGADLQDSAHFLQNLINALVPDGWRCTVYFRRWIEDIMNENHDTTTYLGTYKVFLFGQGRPITREAADAQRLLILDKLLNHYELPIIQRGNWMISNPLPSSLFERYLAFQGISSNK
jgi:hypothetical protein